MQGTGDCGSGDSERFAGADSDLAVARGSADDRPVKNLIFINVRRSSAYRDIQWSVPSHA